MKFCAHILASFENNGLSSPKFKFFQRNIIKSSRSIKKPDRFLSCTPVTEVVVRFCTITNTRCSGLTLFDGVINLVCVFVHVTKSTCMHFPIWENSSCFRKNFSLLSIFSPHRITRVFILSATFGSFINPTDRDVLYLKMEVTS